MRTMITDAAVEAVAKALYADYREIHNAPWDKEYDSIREKWRKSARTALEAALPHLDAPEAGNPVSAQATPSSRWAEAGNPDPHGTQYACERAALAMGHLTDDELANEVFIKGDRKLSYTEMVAGELPASAYLLAAKDRIRWLSRSLAAREPVVVRIRCEYCAGRGEHWGKDDVPVMCGYCEGSGQIIAPTQPAVYACPMCGTGMEVDPTAKPAPTQPHEPKVDLGQFRALSQGWLVGAYALGGDKGRKLALWGCAKELNDLLDLIDSQGAR